MKDKRIVATYLIWTFGITWLLEAILIILDRMNVLSEYQAIFAIIMTLAVFGPAIGAYRAWHKMGEFDGIKSYIQKEIGSKSWKRTVSVVLVIMILMLCIDYLILERTDEKWYLFIIYIPYMCFGGGFEELGWRGFLQPYLEKKMGFFQAVLIMGGIWTCWHLPLWFVSGTAQSKENFLVFSFLLYLLIHAVGDCFYCYPKCTCQYFDSCLE